MFIYGVYTLDDLYKSQRYKNARIWFTGMNLVIENPMKLSNFCNLFI